MKKKFVKPEISEYNLQSAQGQDAMQGQCVSGSYPETPVGLGGACWAGTRVGTSDNCVTGSLVGNPDYRNQCSAGNGVVGSTCLGGGGAGYAACSNGSGD